MKPLKTCDTTMESTSKALASSATCASADLDSMYATLFFDESFDAFENDCMTDSVEVHVIEDDFIEENTTLKEVLENLGKQISSEKISFFNLSRNHVWEGNCRSNLPVTLENLKVLLTWEALRGNFLQSSLNGCLVQLFFGKPTSKFLSLNATSLEEREYFMAGQIFATSLVHGGPGINCLSDSCYDAYN